MTGIASGELTEAATKRIIANEKDSQYRRETLQHSRNSRSVEILEHVFVNQIDMSVDSQEEHFGRKPQHYIFTQTPSQMLNRCL